MTKRLFAYIGISMLVTFSAVFYLQFTGRMIVLGVCVCILLFAFLFKKLRDYRSVAVLIVIVSLLSVVWIGMYSERFYSSVEQYQGKREVVAVVTDIPREIDSMYYYELQTERINDENCNQKLVFRTDNNLNLTYGEKIECEITLRTTMNRYYNARSICLYGVQNNSKLTVRSLGVDRGIRFFPVFLRDKLSKAIHKLLPGEEGDLCRAVILGEKYALSDDTYSDFYKSGLSYNIVVSGMHMSIISLMVLFCLSFLGMRRIAAAVRFGIISVVIVLYMLITGMTPPVVRSGIMILIALFGNIIFRKSDPLNSLGFAALAITAFNPLAVGNIGVLMSFSSTFGIIVFLPKIMKWYDSKFSERNKRLRHNLTVAEDKSIRFKLNFKIKLLKFTRIVFEYIGVSASAFIAITPITLLFFGSANPLVILSSVFVAPFVAVVMIFGLVAAILSFIPIIGFVASGPAFIAGMLSWWILSVVKIAAAVPFSRIYINPTFAAIWLVLTAFAIAVAMLGSNRRRSVWAALLFSVALIGVGISANYYINVKGVKLRVLNCGRGSCVLVQSGERNSLIACGGYTNHENDIINELHYTCGNIDYLIVPSMYWQDSSYKDAVANEFDVKDILLYYKSSDNEKTFRNKKVNCKVFSGNTILTSELCAGVKDTLICRNDRTWQYIDSGEVSVLVAPEYGRIEELPEQFRNPDYLVISRLEPYYSDIHCKYVVWSSLNESPNLGRDSLSTADGTVTIDLRRD